MGDATAEEEDGVAEEDLARVDAAMDEATVEDLANGDSAIIDLARGVASADPGPIGDIMKASAGADAAANTRNKSIVLSCCQSA